MKPDPIIEAMHRYEPDVLCNYLTQSSDRYTIVNKEQAILTKDDQRLFCVALHFDYGWNFSDFDDSTIYFQVVDNEIYGGVFKLTEHRPTTRVHIASGISHGVSNIYIYKQEEYQKMCGKISGI